MTNVSPAQLQAYLVGLSFPARKNEIKTHARNKGAEQEVLNLIDQLPERDYSSSVNLTKAVGN